jgi:4-hydroxythreonine-4-phosphate dehydrogenase
VAAERFGPVLAVTQGDPAGVGPEILLKAALAAAGEERLLLVAERAALEQIAPSVPGSEGLELTYFAAPPDRGELDALPPRTVSVLDPVAERRRLEFGRTSPADALAAVACLDAGIELARSGVVDALVTAPIAKLPIARHYRPDFRGHTDYLAEACGLERYGRDYLMTFLAPDMQVALLTTHQPLREAIAGLDGERLGAALACLDRHAGGRIAVAGLNPHAGENGLLGRDEIEWIGPAVAAARAAGIDALGPESPDSVFSRCRSGEFDWVLALLHDQGLIAVKTASFGAATNWTVGLPFLRTSVDHGTAFHIAGRGLADARPLERVLATTRELVAGRLPRRRTA